MLIYFLINDTVKIFVGGCQESVEILEQGPSFYSLGNHADECIL